MFEPQDPAAIDPIGVRKTPLERRAQRGRRAGDQVQQEQPQSTMEGSSPQKGRLSVSAGNFETVHLLDRLATIDRHRGLVISVFSVVVLLMMLQSYSTIPHYRATARILIDEEQSVLVAGIDASDPVNFWSDSEPYYETQFRILQSPGLTSYTVRKLDLDEVPEFNGEAETQFGPLEALGAMRSGVSGWARTLGNSVLAIIRPDAVTDQPVSSDTTTDLAQRLNATELAQTGGFVARLSVDPVSSSRLVDVSFTSSDPVFAAQAVNTHAETYVERNLARRLADVQQTLEWLNGELSTQQRAVGASDRSLAEYRESQNALSLNANTDVVSTRLATLNEQVSSARAARLQKESLFRQVENLEPESEAARNHPSVAESAAVASATVRLAQLENQLVGLSGRYGPSHPEIIKVNSEIADAQRTVVIEIRRAIGAVRSEYQSALDDEQQLQIDFEAQQILAADLSRKEVDYRLLERQSESDQRVYESLLQNQKELQVVANSRANNVQLMDRAQTPSAPFTPNRQRDWLRAVMVGLILAVGLVAVVGYLDDTVKTPDDISKRLHLPLLGLVPAVKGGRPPLLSSEVPHDFGEAYRSLRTSLVFTGGGPSSRLIGVTSTQPLEGKTTTASNLAVVLALGGARVLLIDGDMRRPSVHKALDLTNAVGLSHVLVGQTRIREAIQRTHDPKLFALTAGQAPPNPSELLASGRMRSMLTSLESGFFDWIIIDAPPILAVTDAAIIAPLVSGVVFVVGAEMTRSAHAIRALEMLQAGDSTNVLGVVLNRVDFARNKYYYSRYYGYHYTSYYGNTPAAA